MVNVTKENFVEQTNDLIKHLPSAAFIAIDEEMTGISIPGTPRAPKDQPPSQQYHTLKQVPERYSIVQLGVSLFHANTEEGSVHDWQSRRYNFYCFPAQESWSAETREVVMNPGSISFLQQHGMSFDLWAKQGVPYQPNDKARETLKHYVDNERKKAQAEQEKKDKPPTIQETVRRKVVLTKPEDIDFHARTMAALREWLDSADPTSQDVQVPEGAATLLPPCNSFLRRALYETLDQQYPSLTVESAGNNQIRVLRLNAEERSRREARLVRESWEKLITNKIGMWRVFEALSRVCRGEILDTSSVLFAPSVQAINLENDVDALDNREVAQSQRRCTPLVVHNGFMDICFLMTHFHNTQLPDTLQSCKQLIRSYFPVVYDTKIVTTECCKTWKNDNSTLGPLFRKLVKDDTAFCDTIELVEQVGYDANDENQEHEAAYDAWMTGCAYIRLCLEIGRDAENIESHDIVGTLHHLSEGINSETARSKYGRNKLYQMSMFTLDLENEGGDPLCRGILPETAVRVSGIDPSVSTRDIIRCLNNLVDSSNKRINFEVIWIDDTSFVVATSVHNCNGDEVAKEHGMLILTALQSRFTKETIATFREVLSEPSDVSESRATGFLSWIYGFFTAKRKADDDDDTEKPAKRARRS